MCWWVWRRWRSSSWRLGGGRGAGGDNAGGGVDDDAVPVGGGSASVGRVSPVWCRAQGPAPLLPVGDVPDLSEDVVSPIPDAELPEGAIVEFTIVAHSFIDADGERSWSFAIDGDPYIGEMLGLLAIIQHTVVGAIDEP